MSRNLTLSLEESLQRTKRTTVTVLVCLVIARILRFVVIYSRATSCGTDGCLRTRMLTHEIDVQLTHLISFCNMDVGPCVALG